MSAATVVIVRCPDADTEYQVFGSADVHVVSLDLGSGFCPSDGYYGDDRPDTVEEAFDWCEGALKEADGCDDLSGSVEYIREQVAAALGQTELTSGTADIDRWPLTRALLLEMEGDE